MDGWAYPSYRDQYPCVIMPASDYVLRFDVRSRWARTGLILIKNTLELGSQPPRAKTHLVVELEVGVKVAPCISFIKF